MHCGWKSAVHQTEQFLQRNSSYNDLIIWQYIDLATAKSEAPIDKFII